MARAVFTLLIVCIAGGAAAADVQQVSTASARIAVMIPVVTSVAVQPLEKSAARTTMRLSVFSTGAQTVVVQYTSAERSGAVVPVALRARPAASARSINANGWTPVAEFSEAAPGLAANAQRTTYEIWQF